MLVLSVAMLPLLLAPLLLSLPSGTEDALLVADWTIWAVFALELVTKTYLAPVRLAYLRGHWFDVAIVVLPFLRPLRVVRSARGLRALRGARLAPLLARAVHSTRAILTEHGLQYVLGVGLLLLLACAGLVTVFEQDSGGTIRDFDDGLWWAMTTVTTVGYGDKFPVTAEGRGIAVFLMLLGITLFGLVTANLAAFLVKPAKDLEEPTLREVLSALQGIEAKLDELQNGATPSERG